MILASYNFWCKNANILQVIVSDGAEKFIKFVVKVAFVLRCLRCFIHQ